MDDLNLENFDRLPNAALVPNRTVRALVGVTRPALDKLMREGLLPRPITLMGSMNRWRVGELRAAIDAMAEKSQEKMRRGGRANLEAKKRKAEAEANAEAV